MSPPDVRTTPPPLWRHQRDAANFASDRTGSLLAMGLGTGKSKTAITLCEHWRAQRVLIVCPTSVLRIWPGQFSQHAHHSWRVVNGLRENDRGRTLTLPIARRVAEADYAIGEREPVAVVVNYEAFAREPMRAWLLAREWDAVVYDEAHRLKATGGRQSWTAVELRPHARRRLGLTGTPLAQGPAEVYAIARALDPTVFGGSRVRFLERWFRCDRYGKPCGFLDEATRVAFTERLGGLMFACATEDVLDLPAVRELPARHVTLGRVAQAAHDALDAELYARLDAGEISAEIVLTALLRMSQIAGGHAAIDHPDGGSRTIRIDEGKRRLLGELLEQPDSGPVVVFCRFTAELDAVRAVSQDQGLRYGEVSGRDRNGITTDGEMSRRVDVLGVQYQAGGQGVDLTRAQGAIWYSPTYSLTDYQQSRGRIHRPGQDRPVWFVRLIAEGTIDERVWRMVDRGESIVSAIIDGARSVAA
jgi:SNF2 family DNA or RNA helicase